jgi:hypothetical protein
MWTWETTRAAVLAGTSSYSSTETSSATVNGSTTVFTETPVGASQSTASSFMSATSSEAGATQEWSSVQDFVVYQNVTFVHIESGTVVGSNSTSFGPVNSSTSTHSHSQFSALTISNLTNSAGLTNATTSVTGTSTHTTLVTVSAPTFTQSYVYSTQTSTTNTPVVTTATSTLGATYPNTSTTSFTETTTGTPTSTTYSALTTVLSSSTYSATVSVTSTANFTTTVNNTSSAANQFVLYDTVVLAASTDWLWSLTAAGPGDPTAVAASFTQTTISFTFGSVTVPVGSYNPTATLATVTYTSASSYQSTTTTYTTSASTSSTYAVGAVPTTTTTTFGSTTGTTVAAALPLTSTVSETITYLTTQGTTLTYCSQQTVSSSFAYNVGTSVTAVFTQTDGTFVTTGAGGTLTTLVTYTQPSANGANPQGAETIFIGDGDYSSFQTVQLINGTSTVTVTNSTTQIASGVDIIGQTNASASTYASGAQAAQTFTSAVDPGGATITFESMLSVTDSTIPPGWQPTPSSFGADNSVGTNISGPSSIEATGSGWPSVSLAVPTGTETYILTGTVPTTDVNQLTTTAFGGFDWVSTTSTKGTLTVGILRVTTCDSFSNTGTTESTFDTGHSTYSMASGQGAAAETVPAVYSASSSQEPNPFVAFPAFPVTT